MENKQRIQTPSDIAKLIKEASVGTRITYHSDEASGTTILKDGTKIFWTEGSESWVVINRPDGEIILAPVYSQDPLIRPLLDEEQQIEENGANETMSMTRQEEAEWERYRNYLQ